MYETQERNDSARDLTLTVLNSAATKREAKAYIKKYLPFSEEEHTSNGMDIDTEEVQAKPLRVSVVRLRDQRSLDPTVVGGIGSLFVKLARLGVSPVVVVDSDSEKRAVSENKQPFRHHSQSAKRKAEEICAAIEKAGGRAKPVYMALEVVHSGSSSALSTSVSSFDSLLLPMKRDIVPVVVPIAYDAASGEDRFVDSVDALAAISEEIRMHPSKSTLEKVVFIDPLGGIPSTERGGRNASHIFVNLKQERPLIEKDLSQADFLDARARAAHLKNLADMDRVLARLPKTAGGIITTPQAALVSSRKNPIVYNILTDRPMISPSLPVSNTKTPVLQTTILRRGVSVQLLHSTEGLSLATEAAKGTVDLSRLTTLINDSFRRELDLDHYMKRVDGRIAAIIIAGDYEGAAIITYEGDKKVPYLDKLAVHSSSQGSSGIADIVFTEMIDTFPDELVWRSRASNPVNKWYFDRSKGSMRVPGSHWIMFWTGRRTREASLLGEYLRVCQSIEPSFK